MREWVQAMKQGRRAQMRVCVEKDREEGQGIHVGGKGKEGHQDGNTRGGAIRRREIKKSNSKICLEMP